MHWYYNALSSLHVLAPTTPQQQQKIGVVYTIKEQCYRPLPLARIQTNSFSNSLAQSSKSESSTSPSEEEEFLSIALPFALPGTFSAAGVGPCDEDPFGDAIADDDLLLFATTVFESCDFRDLAVWIRFARRERRCFESSASETSLEESPVLFRFRLFRRGSDWFDATLTFNLCFDRVLPFVIRFVCRIDCVFT